MVDALFIDPKGIYPQLLGPEHCWDEGRDARTYAGLGPVVAHPPCNLWVNMAAVNWKRYGRQLPAWYLDGTDGGCFASALASVRRWGGVLEHPAGSHAWARHALAAPVTQTMPDFSGGTQPSAGFGWTEHTHPLSQVCAPSYWVCEVWQSAYGSRMRKRTWLVYCGAQPPFQLDWRREPGTHQCGWFDRIKPPVSKREASATPESFARELIRLAEWSRA